MRFCALPADWRAVVGQLRLLVSSASIMETLITKSSTDLIQENYNPKTSNGPKKEPINMNQHEKILRSFINCFIRVQNIHLNFLNDHLL
jgi:hypothetical protein